MSIIKKIMAVALVLCMVLSMSVTAFAAENTSRSPIVSESHIDESIGSRSVNETDTNVTIKGGENLKFQFNMNTGIFGLGTPHNAFNVRITNVSVNSKYTVSITYDGIEIWNKQYTGNCALDVSNCSKGQKWIVLIINDSSQNMSCDYAITSYIE